MPAFNLKCSGGDSVKQVCFAAALRANVVHREWNGKKMELVNSELVNHVRLSHARTFLSPQDSIEGSGLQDGAKVTLHVKSTPLVPRCAGEAPLPVFSFSRQGYGFFVSLVTGIVGRPLFKVKVVPGDTIAKLQAAALRRAKLQGIGPVGTLRIKFRGKTLAPAAKMRDVGIRAGDELALYGLAGDVVRDSQRRSGLSGEVVSRTPRGSVRSLSSSFNALATSPGSRSWLPVGGVNW